VSVTFQRLADRIQEGLKDEDKLKELTQAQIIYMLKCSFLYVGDALSNGEDVYLENFGRFHPDCKAPRKIKSGLTDKTHVTDYKVFVKFTPFKQLNAQVQKFMTKIGFMPEESSMLPHQRKENQVEPEAPFETMDHETAKRWSDVHADNNDEKDRMFLPRQVTANPTPAKDAK
jgi:nucleoid DNA-binding protein